MTGPEETKGSMTGAEKSPEVKESCAFTDEDANSAESGVELAPLELALRQTLQPVELPLGFADRVMAAASMQPPVGAGLVVSIAADRSSARKKMPAGVAKVLPFRSWRVVAGGALAASLVAGSFLVKQGHQRQERQHAAAVANQQFETATRITEQTLERTREQLRRAGVPSLE